MRAIMTPHQQQAIDWMEERKAGLLIMPMGAGKSLATATVMEAVLDRVEVSRWLVVSTPRIAAGVWINELEKWDHLKHLADRYYHITAEDLPVARTEVTRNGTEVKVLKLVNTRQTKAALYRNPASVFTIHFDLLPRLVKLFGDDWPFEGIILDESSMVAETGTARFKAINRVRAYVSHLYLLTGTPASNSIEKIYGQAFLIDKGKRLGRTLTEFRTKFMEPDTVDWNSGRVYKWKPRQGCLESIYAALKEVAISIDIPEGSIGPQSALNSIKVRLPEKARKYYDEIEEEYITSLTDETVIEAVSAAVVGNKLLQVCSGNVYDADKVAHYIHDAKIEALRELIEVTDGTVLVGYWFQHEKEAIQKAFKHAIDIADDPAFEDKWNAGQIKLGIAQAASASHGLNLQQGGSVSVWFGPIWNLEVYLQFNKRLARPGQKAETVYIHHLIVEDSIEEQVMASLAAKEDSQEALINAVKRRINRKLGRVE